MSSIRIVSSAFCSRRSRCVALLLATAGIYATMSFFVSQRTRELGLRVALGAEPRRVVALVVGQGALLTVAGAVIGVGVGRRSARGRWRTRCTA